MLKEISKYSNYLNQGSLVVFPTETVFGLGARADLPLAVHRVYQLKNRPRHNPLILHCSSLQQALDQAYFTKQALTLARKFWPGPLTLVLRVKPNSDSCTLGRAGLKTIAIRIPRHAIARALILATGKPIFAPSANPSGKLSTTHSSHVYHSLRQHGGYHLLDDTGSKNSSCYYGLESTVLDVSGERVKLLRFGSLIVEEIECLLGQKIELPHTPSQEISPQYLSPGMLKAHYAPNKPLRINVIDAEDHEAYIAFGSYPGNKQKKPAANLSPNGSLDEAAHRLFDILHQVQERPERAIAIAPIPNHGIGRAINDRLERAQAAFHLEK